MMGTVWGLLQASVLASTRERPGCRAAPCVPTAGPAPRRSAVLQLRSPGPGQETGPLGRTRTVLPKHLSVGLTRRGQPLWIKSLSCGCTFSEAEVSRGACVQGRAARGTSRADQIPLEKARRSLDTTAVGETCLHGLPAHPPPALLVSGILTPPCFKDVLNVFDLEHVSQDAR